MTQGELWLSKNKEEKDFMKKTTEIHPSIVLRNTRCSTVYSRTEN